MPRANRRRRDEPRPSASPSRGWTEGHDGADYSVRTVPGSAAGKEYRCPGCDQLIRPGVAHVVAWPSDDLDAGDRRHWHTGCWGARGRRGPGVQRSRNAPRY